MAIKKTFKSTHGADVTYWRIITAKRSEAFTKMDGTAPPAGVVLELAGFVDQAFQSAMIKIESIESTLEAGRPEWYAKVMELPEWENSLEV